MMENKNCTRTNDTETEKAENKSKETRIRTTHLAKVAENSSVIIEKKERSETIQEKERSKLQTLVLAVAAKERGNRNRGRMVWTFLR